MNKVDYYLESLYLTEELDLIQEGLGDIVKKFTIDKVKRLFGFVRSGDSKKLTALGNSIGLNRIKPKSMDSFANSRIANFSSSKDLAKKVLKNSMPGLSKKMLEAASSTIAAASVVPKRKGVVVKSPQRRTKELIKEVVVKSRKWQDDYMDARASEETDKTKRTNFPRDF